MKFLDEQLNTQYNDLKGIAGVDFHNGGLELKHLCKIGKVNTEENFPIGLKLSHYSSLPEVNGAIGLIGLTILTVKTEKYGKTFDEIEKTIKEGGGSVIIDRHAVFVELAEIFKRFKRLDIIMLTSLSQSIRGAEFPEVEDEDPMY